MSSKLCTRCSAAIDPTDDGWQLCARCRPPEDMSIAEMIRRARAEERVRCAEIVRAKNRQYVKDANEAEAARDVRAERTACDKSDAASEIESEIRALGDLLFDKHALFAAASRVEEPGPGESVAAGRPVRRGP